jgi:hypothetical protein
VISSGLYRASVQCALRAWLRARGTEPAAEPGNLDALEQLRALLPLRFPAVGVRFGERIGHADVEARCDVYQPCGDGSVRIGAARATTQVRAHDVDALVLPYWILRQRGVSVASAEVLYLNPDYAGGPDLVDPEALILSRDVRSELEFLSDDVAGELDRLRALLSSPEPPDVPPSPHCHRPRTCGFFPRCSEREPRDSIAHLPALTPARHAALRQLGAVRIDDIPADFPLTPRQARAQRAHRTGAVEVSPELASALRGSGPPADYLDFETFGPVLPPFAGTRPLQPIPLQWSLHRLESDGTLSHHAFLAEGSGDPRRGFAERLLAALGRRELPVLVYSPAEGELVQELARALPDLRAPLEALRSRFVDLLPAVREHVYHPDFQGSFRLKRVASVLCSGLSWDDLPRVRDGAGAARALARLARGGLASHTVSELRAALFAYCERDTLALVELHRALRELSRAAD